MPETYDPTKHRFGETVKFLPVAFVISIIIGLWLIYTFYHCYPRPETRWDNINYDYVWAEAIIFNISTLLLFVCYIRCILVHPGTIPEDDPHWNYVHAPDAPGGANLAELAAVGMPIEKKKTGERRSCKWCSKYKPDRCHHCRVCRMCILKMDHHCPWIYNCVGFNNHKYFFLLLLYSTIDCHIIMWTMKDSMYAALDNPNTPFMSMFLLLFGETLTAFLGLLVTVFFSFHVWLMFKAMTTIEFCEKSMKKLNYDGSIYDRGNLGNIKAVLGDNIFFWFLPIAPPSGTGMNFQSEDPLLPRSPRHPGQSKDYGSLSGNESQSYATGAGTMGGYDRDMERGVAPLGDSGAPARRKPKSGGQSRERRPGAGTGAAPDYDLYGSEEEGSASEDRVADSDLGSRDESNMQVTAAAATFDTSEQQAREHQAPEFTGPSTGETFTATPETRP